ncbi:MAG: rod shape-determining protein MreC, partial [Oscillospiraceae bacterium]
MKDFFYSIKFKILVCILVLTAGVMTYAAANGRLSAAPQELLSAVMVPFQRIGAVLSNGIGGVWEKFAEMDKVSDENKNLKKELADLRSQMVDYDQIKVENDMYRKTMQIENENSEYVQVLASVIGRDPVEKYFSFTIDKGKNAGIKEEDVVYTAEGLVGKVLEVGPNYAKVITILDPRVNAGCTISRTREIGTAAGNSELAQQSKLALRYLPKETLAGENDIVVTTGYGE